PAAAPNVPPQASAAPMTTAAPDWPPAAKIYPAPRALAFPADDGAHDALTEWWYYNGHLQGDAGQRYGFELVVFKRQARQGRSGYAAHFAVTDHTRRSFQFGEDLSLPGPQEPRMPGTFNVSSGAIVAGGGGGQDRVTGVTAD